MILTEFFETQWWPYQQSRLRESTLEGYESAWALHIKPVFGHMEMSDIDRHLVEAWAETVPTPGAAKKAWAVLRAVLRKAQRWDVLEYDRLSGGVDLPKVPHYDAPWLQPRDLRTMLEGFYGHRLEAWVLSAAGMGLRTEEGLALDWDRDFRWRTGTVRIEHGLQWVKGHEVEDATKTDLSTRELALGKRIKKRLRELRGHGRLIGDLTPIQATRMYKSWCVRNDLPFVPAQNLRTTWGTNALKADIDIAVVAKQFGHSDIGTTARYYLKADVTILRDAQNTWEKAVFG